VKKRVFIPGFLFCLAIGGFTPGKVQTVDTSGYREITFYNGKYLAVGTEGRIDYISNSGDKTAVISPNRNNLNCLVSNDKVVIIGGDKGTILFSSDGKIFTTVDPGINDNINGITFRNETFVAGADRGTILISKNGSTWSSIKSGAKGNIVSVTSNDSFFLGITGDGEILTSGNGIDWKIQDYNKEYSGYNRPCEFSKVLAANDRVVIIGKHDDNTPAVLFSTLGNVWTERTLIYEDDNGEMRYLSNEPNAVAYDAVRDQFILACDKGEILSLPPCSKCNVSATLSGSDLYAITCTENLLIAVGRGFSVNIIKL
jgi:hypothetical protein